MSESQSRPGQEFTDLPDFEIYYTVFHADSHGVANFSRKWITVAPPIRRAFSDPLAIKKS